MEGSDDTTSPFSDQWIFRGSSPFFTKQESCALSPSFIESDPKENGTSSGGSEINMKRFSYMSFKCNFQWPPNLNLPLSDPSQLPLTLSSAAKDWFPALLELWHVNMPLWRYPTLLIISMLVLVPIMVVVIEGSEEIKSPFSDHEIRSGSSPFCTKQISWTMSPSFVGSVPKENGTILGGSEIKKRQRSMVSAWTCNLLLLRCSSYY